MVFLIVEGSSDKILLGSQISWFESYGLRIHIISVGGKANMIRKANNHYNVALLSGADYVIFMPDQNSDSCAMETRTNIGMDSKIKAITNVFKRELEAWILADGQCIRNATGQSYSPAGLTDLESDPKRRLRSTLETAIGYPPSTREAIDLIMPHFSIDRAINYNSSANRFKDKIEEISKISST